MSIEARQIQETLYSYAAILNFTPSPQGLRAKFGACSVQNAQLLYNHIFVFTHHKNNRFQKKRGEYEYMNISSLYPITELATALDFD